MCLTNVQNLIDGRIYIYIQLLIDSHNTQWYSGSSVLPACIQKIGQSGKIFCDAINYCCYKGFLIITDIVVTQNNYFQEGLQTFIIMCNGTRLSRTSYYFQEATIKKDKQQVLKLKRKNRKYWGWRVQQGDSAHPNHPLVSPKWNEMWGSGVFG